MKKGEITVFLSLLFVLLISFAGALLESTSIQVSKNYRKGNVVLAADSVFAEYQRELLEEYDVFALEGSYETGTFSYENIINRLAFYGSGNEKHRITRAAHLTDGSGKAFYEQALAYMHHKCGTELSQKGEKEIKEWGEQKEQADRQLTEEEQVQENLNQVLKDADSELPEENNPLQKIAGLKNSGILKVVWGNEKPISQNELHTGNLVSRRKLKKGFGSFPEAKDTEGAMSKLMFTEYLKEHFGHAAEEKKERALSYELEYIIAGKQSDRENLESIVYRLIGLRYAPNYLFLLEDAEMQSEAEAFALTLSAGLGLPIAEKLVKQAVLLAWAYGESIMDVRTLLQDRKVPAVKRKEDWQLQLSGLLKLGEEEVNDAAGSKEGLTYQEYLSMLICLEGREELTMRSLDLIEENLRTKGKSFFYADQCISRLEVESICTLPRDVTYSFRTFYQYE